MEDGEKNKKKRNGTVKGKKKDIKWVISITIISFIISAFILYISNRAFENTGIITALIVVLIIVLVGIIFDIIGVAVTSAEEDVFHSMASKRIKGARQAILLVRNANKVSNFCNDVVGDICGVISGSASALIVINIIGSAEAGDISIFNIIISGVVAALTVGGKGMGKTIAIRKSTFIVYRTAVIVQFFKRKKEIERKF